MNRRLDPETNEVAKSVDLVAVLLIALAVFVFFYLIHLVLLPFVFAAGVGLVLTSVADWLAARTRAPRAKIALLIFLIVLGLVGLAAYFAVPVMAQGMLHVIGDIQRLIEQPLKSLLGNGTAQIFGQAFSADDIAATLVARLKGLAQQANGVSLVATAFGGVFGFFLTLTLLAYFLIDGRKIVRGVVWIFPPDWRASVWQILHGLRPVLLRYFAGIAAIIIYASGAAYLGLGVFLKLNHALFLAVLAGILEVMPVVGPGLSAVVAGLAAVQQAKSVWSIVLYVVYACALRLSIDQLVGPLVLGKAGRVHPTLVIFCFLAGGALFGIVGVVLAVPLALTIKVTLEIIYGEPVEARQGSAGN